MPLQPSMPGATYTRRPRSGRTLGAVAGIFLLPGAVALLVVNENRAASTRQALVEGAGVVREAPADRIDPLLDGKLVHVAGPLAVPGAALADPDFPAVQAPAGTVQLKRTVRTYQWEEVTGRGGSRSYRQVWSDAMIDSSRFQQPGGPQNPPPRYRSQELVAPEAAIGPYRLTERLLRSVGGGQPLALTDDAPLARAGTRLNGNGVYVGQNPDAPQVGDQRLAWEAVRLSEASVVAQQHGTALVPYEARSGASVHLISRGLLTAKEVIGDAEQANVFGAWLWRVSGACLLFLSSFLILRLLLRDRPAAADGGAPTLMDRAAGIGPAPAAAVVTVVAAPAVVATAWLAARSLVWAGVLALGLAALHLPQAQACAVATTVHVKNEGKVPVRSLHLSGAFAGPNQLPPAGLAPGGAATITLPSCIGTYEVSAVFADGRTIVHPALDAATIRRLSLR